MCFGLSMVHSESISTLRSTLPKHDILTACSSFETLIDFNDAAFHTQSIL